MALNNLSNISKGKITKVPVVSSKPLVDSGFQLIANLAATQNTTTITNTTVSNEFYASKLLNYVEPVNIFGQNKTAFYSELATEFNVGDRVFVLNGFYDSDDFIQKYKYEKFSDGYRVLGVDGCKIILDIDYTGDLPYKDYNLEDLFFIHNIKTQAQFDYINSLRIGLSQSTVSEGVYSMFFGYRASRGNQATYLYGQNMIFSETSFTGSTSSVSPSSEILLSEPSLFVKQSDSLWAAASNGFTSGEVYLDDSSSETGFRQATRFVVIGEDFTLEGKTYRERQVYKWDPTDGNSGGWVFDKEYKQPVISRLNFRYGVFKGIHKDGVFGSYDRVAKWDNATWDSGFFVNGQWNLGDMNNKSRSRTSFTAKIDITGGTKSVLQNRDITNNRGFGFNYIQDSDVKVSNVKKGNFENCNIGLSYSTNIIEQFYENGLTYSVTTDGSRLNFCDVYTTNIANSNISDSIIKDSVVFKSKLVNNQFIDSVMNDTQYISEGGIEILDADIWSYDPTFEPSLANYTRTDFEPIRGVLKLYISDKDFLRLEKGDSLYIEKINKDYFLTNLNSDDRVHLSIENKYLMDLYDDYEIYTTPDTPDRKAVISVSLKPINVNKTKFFVEETTEQVTTEYFHPNVDTINSIQYWERIENYNGNWDEFGVYASGSYVLGLANSIDTIYKYTGFTDSNPIPGSEDLGVIVDYAWKRMGTYSGIYDSTLINTVDDYVLGYEPNDDLNYLYACLNSTEDFTNPGFVDANTFLTDYITAPQIFKKHTTVPNVVNYSSIDIDSDSFGWYLDLNSNKVYKPSSISLGSDFTKLPINDTKSAFEGNYIKVSDIRSGLFINSTWRGGYNQNYFGNIIDNNNGSLNIQYFSDTQLSVYLRNRKYDSTHDTQGFDIKRGDSVWLNSVEYLYGTYSVSLSGRWLVTNTPSRNNTNTIVTITPQFSTESFKQFGATYSIFGAETNTYTTLSKLSIENSTIISGFFKRSSFKNIVFDNPSFNNFDSDLLPNNLNNLRLINIIFKSNNLTINDGVIYKSHFVDGNFNSGIVHSAIWNGGTFSSGIFSSGFWQNGNFLSGRVINSRGMNQGEDYTGESLSFDSNVIWRGWLSGKFQTGEFFNSIWLGGDFLNGKFYYSDFYGGTWVNGTLGRNNLSYKDTTFGHYNYLSIGETQSLWRLGTVENALMGGYGKVYWYNGIFNSGELTSYGATDSNETIWYNGEFNGSRITHLARWKDGTFNNGKFWSYYGWENVGPTNSSSNPTDYSWEAGNFNSGDFGYGGLTANSVWYGGRFISGIFSGRFWNNGYFANGKFFGSGTTSGIISSSSSIYEFDYANSFTTEYYGIWKDGYVLKNLTELPDQEGTNAGQDIEVQIGNQPVQTAFENVLWMGGTFTHDSASIVNSLWLNGSFRRGTFDGGVFNPYIDRDFTGSFSNSTFGENAVWFDGIFKTGSFWYSNWKRGLFKSGYMSGAKWENGTWEYGTAENIFWMDGTWRNGNWDGSPYDFSKVALDATGTYAMIDGREKEIFLKVGDYRAEFIQSTGATLSFTNEPFHMINVFSASAETLVRNDGLTGSSGWTFSQSETYDGLVYTISGGGGFSSPRKASITGSPLLKSTWKIERTFNRVKSTKNGSLEIGGISYLVKVPARVETSRDYNIVTYGGQNSYNLGSLLNGYNIFSRYDPTTFVSLVDVPESVNLYAVTGGTTSFFTQVGQQYTVTLSVAVELAKTVEVEVYVGSLSFSRFALDSDEYHYTKNGQEIYDYYAKIYSLKFSYYVTTDNTVDLSGKQFYISKKSNGILRILNARVTTKIITYHPSLNNILQESVNLIDRTVNLPSTPDVVYQTLSSDGSDVGLKFGNGIFKSGTWENGVWNNGYRSADWFPLTIQDLVRATDVVQSKTYKLNNTTWIITIQLFDGVSRITTTRRISIGNIVSIDINGKRRLLRQSFKVRSINVALNQVTLEFVPNFEIRQIVKDSTNHLIYLTQNIWLNGVFLNGFFQGVWVNGVFRGSPSTTEMFDSHFVDGYFEGGHFKSINIPTSNGLPSYNTGLIQNFIFKDKNLAQAPSNSYQSWIDVVYRTNSSVNLNFDVILYGTSTKSQQIPKKTEAIIPNLNGYATDDVLSSTSYLRNSRTNVVTEYKLGTKGVAYSNKLFNEETGVDYGQFKRPFASNIPSLGLLNLTNNGWTYSVDSITGWNSPHQLNNGGVTEMTVISNLSSTASLGVLDITFPGKISRGRFNIYLKNTFVRNLPENRYYRADVETPKTIPNFNGVYSFDFVDTATQPQQTLVPKNFQSTTSISEYFYNLNNLDITIGVQDILTNQNPDPVIYRTNMNIQLKRIGLYEVDMIPFFKYYPSATASIDLTVKNPIVAVAPIIDYTDTSFDFVGNVDLGIDFRVINNQNRISITPGKSSIANNYSEPFEEIDLGDDVVSEE